MEWKGVGSAWGPPGVGLGSGRPGVGLGSAWGRAVSRVVPERALLQRQADVRGLRSGWNTTMHPGVERQT
jgi:hypothetical protein